MEGYILDFIQFKRWKNMDETYGPNMVMMYTLPKKRNVINVTFQSHWFSLGKTAVGLMVIYPTLLFLLQDSWMEICLQQLQGKYEWRVLLRPLPCGAVVVIKSSHGEIWCVVSWIDHESSPCGRFSDTVVSQLFCEWRITNRKEY